MNYTTFNSLHNPQGTRHSASWADVCRMLQDVPAYQSKAEQPLLKLGVFEGDSRGAGHSLTTISGVEIDYDAGEVTAHSAAKLLRQAGIECVVCSTYTSRMDCPKWRVFAPTSREIDASLRQYLVTALDAVIGNIAARESYTPKQTFFYGRNPASNYVFMHLRGEFVDLALRSAANAAYLADDKREKAEREQLAATACLRAETQRNRKAAGRLTEGQISPITAFNDAHDVRSILKTHGYRESGKKFVAPTSQSGMAGVVILQGDDGRERAFSHHSNDPVADGLAHDAFDLFCILDHAGDEWAAIQAAARLTNVGHETVHSHNRHIYRQAQQAAKAQAALNKIRGITA